MILHFYLHLQNARFSVMRLNRVSTRRQTFDHEVSVRIGDCKEGMLNHVHVGKFPGMHIALKFEETFRFHEFEFHRGLTWQEGAVRLAIPFGK